MVGRGVSLVIREANRNGRDIADVSSMLRLVLHKGVVSTCECFIASFSLLWCKVSMAFQFSGLCLVHIFFRNLNSCFSFFFFFSSEPLKRFYKKYHDRSLV